MASQILHDEPKPICGNSTSSFAGKRLNFNDYTGLAQDFDFTGYDSLQEWIGIKADVQAKLVLLNCIWRGKGSEGLAGLPAMQARAQSYERDLGQPLNIGGIIRCDAVLGYLTWALLYFCVGVYFCIYFFSEGRNSELHIPSLFSFPDPTAQLIASSLLIVFASLPIFLVLVGLIYTQPLKRGRKKHIGDAVEAIRAFYKSDILTPWVRDMRDARELLSFGNPDNIEGTSANNAYHTVSIWRRLERFADKTASYFRFFIRDQKEYRAVINTIAFGISTIPFVLFVSVLAPQVINGSFDYFIAIDFLIVMSVCWAIAVLVTVPFYLSLRKGANSAITDLTSALSDDPPLPTTPPTYPNLTALEETIAELDPFDVFIGRYKAALEDIEKLK